MSVLIPGSTSRGPVLAVVTKTAPSSAQPPVVAAPVDAFVPAASAITTPAGASRRRTIESYNRAFTWNAKLVAPRTLRELAKDVKAAGKIRVVGSSHSFNACVVGAPGAIALSLQHFKHVGQVKSVNEVKGVVEGEVTVQAGATIRELSEALAKQQFGIETLPTSVEITVGGAVANGVHGSGGRSGAAPVISDSIKAMTVMTTDGTLVKLTKEDDLKAARIGLGLMGVIVDVTFRVIPTFNLIGTAEQISEEVAVATHAKAMAEHDHVSWFWSPEKKQVTRYYRDVATSPELPGRLVSAYEELPPATTAAVQNLFDAAPPDAQTPINEAACAAIHSVFMGKPGEPIPVKSGRSDYLFYSFSPWRIHDQSIAVPAEKLGEALDAVRAAMASVKYRSFLPFAVRFLPASDKTLLGINADHAVAVIEMFATAGKKNARAFQAVEQGLRRLGGRAHWGKEFTEPTIGISRAKAKKWNALRRTLDPTGKLLSSWSEGILKDIGVDGSARRS